MVVAFRELIRDLVHPERAGEAATRAAFREEATTSNAVTARWMLFFLCPLHAAVIIVFLALFDESDPARALWLSRLVGINALLLASALPAAFVLWKRRPSLLFRALGDIGGAVYLMGGAAMTANAQRAYPNINLFVITAFFTAFRMRMSPVVYLSALVAGAALVVVSMVHFRTDAVTRMADTLTLISASSISLVAFLLSRRMRFRELQARVQIQKLNAQLNEKIRERSRELSMALARLGESHQVLRVGAILGGRVELAEPLGQGAAGIVYRGRDLLTDAAVAVKVIQAGSSSELEGLHRFLQEARIVASLTHGAIVRLLHVDVSDDGLLFQVMELVEGETLDARLSQGGSLSPAVAARLGAVLADALATAHKAGIVHLDVKPANVILTSSAPGLKLLDFGISKLRGARAHDGGSEIGIVGTPEFLSPEQVMSPSSVDDRADVYALGLLLFAAIAGRPPFEVSSPQGWITAHVEQAPRELGDCAPGVSPALARVVMSCLHKDPRQRRSAAELAATLTALADSLGAAPLEELVSLSQAGAAERRSSHDRLLTADAARTQPSWKDDRSSG